MRLSKEDWLDAARKQMGEEGPAGIKVEVLARELGVSKGSFYWHFKDREDLLWSLLSYWEASTESLIAKAREESDPYAALGRLFHEIDALGVTGELGIFAWGKREPLVAARVEEVEKKRIGFLVEIFLWAGWPEEEAFRRSRLMYLAFLGYLYRGESAVLPSFSYLGAEMLALFLQRKEEKPLLSVQAAEVSF